MTSIIKSQAAIRQARRREKLSKSGQVCFSKWMSKREKKELLKKLREMRNEVGNV